MFGGRTTHQESQAPRVAPGLVAPAEPLIRSTETSCRECWSCVRDCPAKAIRVVAGHCEVIEERCVKCGACVSECSSDAFRVRDDTGRVVRLLATGRPVVAILATEFVAAMHPLSPMEVERTLESVGFHAVETTLLGEELVALEYERSHARPCPSLTLRSTCPVVADWVRRYHPSLSSTLTPIVPPYVAQARLVRAVYPADTAVVYVSPCYARKDEIYESGFAGAVDVAIDFLELQKLLAELKPRPPLSMATHAGTRRPQPLKEISLIDGFPRRTLESHLVTDAGVQTVRGLRQLDRLLAAIERGEAAPSVIDALNCEGCIDGPAVKPGMSVFAKRNVMSAERSSGRSSGISSRALLSYLPQIDVLRTFKPAPVKQERPSAEEIDAELQQTGFISHDEPLDCGACGYDTCADHAIAIISDRSTWEMCFPLQKERMRQNVEELEESATVDPLTGLWNRRVFDKRLAEEVARTERYGTPVSLLVLDIDAFKAVNDGSGHTVGDEVLCGVGRLITELVRETDIPIRYGGDEFAIILPGIGKTEAYVVGEKLCEAVSKLSFVGDTVKVTVSIGVAAASGHVTKPLTLLEAADSAMYTAKRSGRNQVRLAAG
ncbi:MAG: diguanylate cyclase [Actinomycetota bacterium]|nr:diguanylate cyclase [Actinomycetota bacterium]